MPSWPAAIAALAIAAAPGTTTLTGISTVWVTGEADGPNVAVMVASSVLFSGVEASGVSVIVSVVDCPTASDDRGQAGERQARGERVGQGDVVLRHVADVRDRERVGDRAARDGAHGRRAGGHRDGVDPGTVNVSVCVWVIDESVVLVAVTVNESCVPGGGIGWPVFGTR